MPELKTKSEEFIGIDYAEFERFVEEVYQAKNYSFVEIEECGNDSAHIFRGITKNIPSWCRLEDIDATKKGNICSNSLLLRCLVQDGYLQPGSYLITVSW